MQWVRGQHASVVCRRALDQKLGNTIFHPAKLLWLHLSMIREATSGI
jgi:hypothetical protein